MPRCRYRNRRRLTPPNPVPLVTGGQGRTGRDAKTSALVWSITAAVALLLVIAAGWLRTAVLS